MLLTLDPTRKPFRNNENKIKETNLNFYPTQNLAKPAGTMKFVVATGKHKYLW